MIENSLQATYIDFSKSILINEVLMLTHQNDRIFVRLEKESSHRSSLYFSKVPQDYLGY